MPMALTVSAPLSVSISNDSASVEVSKLLRAYCFRRGVAMTVSTPSGTRNASSSTVSLTLYMNMTAK